MNQADCRHRASLISFQQLRLFESAARLESIRQASEECSISQPAVTQSLAKLETLIGAVLVERRTNGSYVNDLGAIFARRVSRFFSQIEQALTELGAPGGRSGAQLIARRLSQWQIRALIAITDSNAFADAADGLGVSQRSLQRATRELEGNVSVALFHRSAAGMTMTLPGKEFGRQMKLALQEIAFGLHEIEIARGGPTSELVIGAMSFGGSMLLASALEQFIKVHPRVSVRVVTETAAVLIKTLHAGDVDCIVGLLPQKPKDSIAVYALRPTPYAIVARRHHPILRKGRLTIEDMLEYDWIVGIPGSSRRACFDAIFAGRQPPHASIVTCSVPIVRQLLGESDQLTLMTRYELQHEKDLLAPVSFDRIDLVPALGLMTRSNWLPTPIHADFIHILRSRSNALVDFEGLRKVG